MTPFLPVQFDHRPHSPAHRCCPLIQIDAAEAFSAICTRRLMAPTDLQASLLPIICRNINKEKSEEVI